MGILSRGSGYAEHPSLQAPSLCASAPTQRRQSVPLCIRCPKLIPGTHIGGKYLIRKSLAAGGMGEVFLCEHLGKEGFSKTVVLKTIHRHLSKDEAFLRMFSLEARLTALFRHHNVVQTIDFGHADGQHYLVMEFVDGRSVKEVVTCLAATGKVLSPLLAAHIAAEVATGLHYVHTKSKPNGEPLNVVHRDVTPHNIMLSFDGSVKVMDFGIAKAGLATSVTSAGMLKGKLAYMSPEQANGEENVDGKTDVFALGVTLWEMLTGRRLFDGKRDEQIIVAVHRAKISAPSSLRAEIPPELDAIVMHALERARENRPTAQHLTRALSAFVNANCRTTDECSVQKLLAELYPKLPEVEGNAWTVPLPDLSEEPRRATAAEVTRSRAAEASGVQQGSTQPLPPGPIFPSIDLAAVPEPKVDAIIETNPSKTGTRSARGTGGRRWALLVAVLGAASVGVVLALRRESNAESHTGNVDVPPRPDPKTLAVVTAPAPMPAKDPLVVAGVVESVQPTLAAPAVTEVAQPTFGALLIRVPPLTNVTVDGVIKGFMSGTQRLRLPVGRHEVRFQNLGREQRDIVEIRPGATVERTFRPR